MAVKTVEAQLVLGGKDGGAAAAVNAIVKAFEQAEKAGAGVSKSTAQVAKTLLEVEKAQKAVDAVMGARNGAAAAEANLQRVTKAAGETKTALDKAQAAVKAFDGQKPAKGTDLAKQMNDAAKAATAAEKAQKSATREVAQATRAVEMQARALRDAERAATAANVPLKALEQHQAHLARAYDQTSDALRRQIRLEGEAARAAQHHAREQAEAARHIRQHGAIGLAAGAAAGAVSAHSVVHHTTDALKAGARLQHETVALRNAGRTPHELEEIAKASERTVKAVPTATFEENLKVVNETVSAFGSLEHALEHLTFMQKASAAVHAAAGGKITDSAGEMGNKLARFAEERGSAGDGHRFERETEGLVRAMVFSGGNFNPHEAINFAQQAKSSLRGYDEEFLTTIMPSIVGTMKGERAGTAANAFNNVINGKVNDKKQAEEWLRYGLLDKSQVIMKAGHATAWRSGAVKNTTLAHQNPLKWMETVVLPALKAKGVDIDDDEALSKVFATMFRQNTSNFFANEIGLKSFRARLHKDAALQKQTGSLDDIYHRNLTQDPTEGVKAFKAGIEDLMAAATNPLMVPAAAGLKTLAEGLQSLALMAKDHPMLAAGAGGAVVAGALGASGYASYKLATGFGLPGAAAELTVAAKALEAAAAKQMGGGLPGGPAASGVPALVGLGLGGSIIALGGAAAFAGSTTAQELPKIAEKEGPGAIDPATGEHLDTAIPQTTPWLRDWWVKKFGTAPKEAGKDAGEKAGDGIKEGIKEKAPETVEQAQSLYDKIKDVFKNPIYIPMSFEGAGGGFGGGAGIQKASFSTGGGNGGLGGYSGGGGYAGEGGGTGSGYAGHGSDGSGYADGGVGRIVKGSGGNGLGGSGYRRARGGVGSGAGDGLKGGSAFEGGRTKNQQEVYRAMIAMGLPESSARAFVANVSGESIDNPADFHWDGKHTAEAMVQWDPTRAARIAQHFGIRPRAMSPAQQTAAAMWEIKKFYPGVWAAIQAGGDPRAILYKLIKRYESPQDVAAAFNHRLKLLNRFKPGAVADAPNAPTSAGEPRLVKGLDGKEGLDLGDGTMRMPDGSIRSITNGGGPRSIPDAPKARSDAGSLQAAADRMHAAAERMESMSLRTHHTVEVNAGPGLNAKAKKMRIQSDGPVRGNVGVSMPQTEIA